MGRTTLDVTVLRYAANDESGTFCEALKLTTPRGSTRFMLHRARSEPDRIVHERLVLPDEKALLKAFPDSFNTQPWKTTNSGCGYGITQEMYHRAEEAYRARRD